MAAGKAAGLVDVKVVKFSETHTAEKFVNPRRGPALRRPMPHRSTYDHAVASAREPLLYANTASVGLLHPAVASSVAEGAFRLAREDFYDSFYGRQFREIESTRDAVAALVGVDRACICLVSSTSEGIALFLNALALGEGDVVAVGGGAFISIEAAIERLRVRLGVQRVEIGREDGLVTPSDVESLPPRTKVVLMDWVNYWSGIRNDVGPLARACRSKGIPLLLDGVQGFGAAPMDFDMTEVGAMAVGCHKWLRGPEGTGFLSIAPWILPSLVPIFAGYRSVQEPLDLDASTVALGNEAKHFEVGTMPYLSFAALGIALRMYLEEGYASRVNRVRSTATALMELLKRERAISITTPADEGSRAGIVSFADRRFHTTETLSRLREHGVVAGSRRGLVRISAGPEVDEEELIRSARAALAIR